MSEQSFVERLFELGDQQVIVRFHTPTLEPTRDYKCRWTLAWPDREERGHAYGADGVQALMLAMRSVHTKLVNCDAYKEGRLTYANQADLDLPPTWGVGPLYDAGPRPER